MESEISVLQVEKRIRSRVKRQMEKTQREYYLNEQMKAIQKELGDDEGRDELSELEDKIEKTKFTKEARDKAMGELKKLRQMSPMSAEATVVRNYLDWLLGIPWGKRSKIKKDLIGAQTILDDDHFGLEKVKERIVEYLAVQQRTNKLHGPILCLVGPPGVGKTSLGKSIARATGREFVRMSLGGVRDEAEIRGHRRTYIGSMPGKIVQSMRKAKTSNPLILLDEIDKMGMDFRGDPSAALLEVLDPEQNHTFNDHYLEVDYDLSNVMFITTANTLNIPPALLDRMEVIRIAGYTEDEKVEIARKHLIPNAIKKHGLDAKEWSITDEGLLTLVRRYTREAGVRNLERELSNLNRKAVKEILITKSKTVTVTPENLGDFLGVPKFRYGELEDVDQVGVATGLAWTEVGGELLTIEGVLMPGKGKMTVTGNLKDVMKESISAAASYVRSRAVDFGIEPPLFDRRDIHVHVPEGATPKDGPSAGIAMAIGDRFGHDRDPAASRRRHDRRGDAAWPHLADRGPQGEAPRGAARGHQEGADPGREREGSRRNPGLGEERHGDRAGRAHGPGSRARARAHARAYYLGRALAGREAGRHGAGCRRGGRPRDGRALSGYSFNEKQAPGISRGLFRANALFGRPRQRQPRRRPKRRVHDAQIERRRLADPALAEATDILRVEPAETAGVLERHDPAAVGRPPVFEDVEFHEIVVRRRGDEDHHRLRAFGEDAGLRGGVALGRHAGEGRRCVRRRSLALPEAAKANEARPVVQRLVGRHELDDRRLRPAPRIFLNQAIAAEGKRRRLGKRGSGKSQEGEKRGGNLQHASPFPTRPRRHVRRECFRLLSRRRRSIASPTRSARGRAHARPSPCAAGLIFLSGGQGRLAQLVEQLFTRSGSAVRARHRPPNENQEAPPKRAPNAEPGACAASPQRRAARARIDQRPCRKVPRRCTGFCVRSALRLPAARAFAPRWRGSAPAARRRPSTVRRPSRGPLGSATSA